MKTVAAFAVFGSCLLHSFALADAFSNRQGMASLRRPDAKTISQTTRDRAPLLPDTLSPRGGGGGTRGSPTLAVSPVEATAVVFSNVPLFQYLGVVCATNVVGFLLSVATGSFLHVDLLGAGAFGLATIPALMGKGAALTRVKASSVAVALWSAKLAGFLFVRAVKAGHDARVSGMLETTGGAAGFWVASAVWGILCSVPHTLGITSSAAGSPVALATGSVMFAVGLVIETLADYQKWTFKAANPGQFCNVGLWSVSQHPNFFGNLLLWAGILVMNAPALIEPISAAAAGGGGAGVWDTIWSYRRLGLGVLSVVSMYFWFLGQANGTLTPAVELANKRYGNDPSFVDYVAKVPLILPFKIGK